MTVLQRLGTASLAFNIENNLLDIILPILKSWTCPKYTANRAVHILRGGRGGQLCQELFIIIIIYFAVSHGPLTTAVSLKSKASSLHNKLNIF